MRNAKGEEARKWPEVVGVSVTVKECGGGLVGAGQTELTVGETELI